MPVACGRSAVGDDGGSTSIVPQGARLAVRDGDRVKPATGSPKGRLTRTSCSGCVALRRCSISSEKCRRLPQPGRGDQRQAHRSGRAPDDAQGEGGGPAEPTASWRERGRIQIRGSMHGAEESGCLRLARRCFWGSPRRRCRRQLPVGGVVQETTRVLTDAAIKGRLTAHRPEERHHRQADPWHRHVQYAHQACGRCRGRRRPGAGHRAFSHGAHAWSRWSSGAGGPACRCCCRRRWRRARCAAENGAFRPTEGRAGAGHAYAGRPGGRERLGSAEAEGAPGAPCYHRHRCEGGGVLPVGRSGEGDEPADPEPQQDAPGARLRVLGRSEVPAATDAEITPDSAEAAVPRSPALAIDANAGWPEAGPLRALPAREPRQCILTAHSADGKM